MTDKVIVLVTCGSADEAERIARALVEERLAACVNVTGGVRSIYRWKAEVNEDEERLLVVKTVRPLFDQVRRAVEKRHSYEVPEVICLPIIDGAPNYLNWLGSEVVRAGEPETSGGSRPRPVKRKK